MRTFLLMAFCFGAGAVMAGDWAQIYPVQTVQYGPPPITGVLAIADLSKPVPTCAELGQWSITNPKGCYQANQMIGVATAAAFRPDGSPAGIKLDEDGLVLAKCVK